MSKKLYVALITTALIAIVISLYFLIAPFFESANNTETFDSSGIVSDSSYESSVMGTNTILEIPVDFNKLWETNTDVYAWLRVPGTNIDYPILQSADNTYYLNHTWDKKEYKAGSIFTETYNSKDFNDPNTVIYGHRMYAGDMFAKLQNFSEADFFDENRIFYIYTPIKIMTYEIVAAFPFGEEHLLFEYNFFDEYDFNRFVKDAFSVVDFRASFLENVQIEYGVDKLVTLSTCLKGNSNRRYLVLGKLINTEE